MISGSISCDWLHHYPGRFADHIVADGLDRLSLSFLADELATHWGGVGANLAFGMGVLGRRPLLVGAAGQDFGPYEEWLREHGVDCSGVLLVEDTHTARFTCTTDDDQCQLATFYPGAMSQARTIALAPLAARHGTRLVVIGANDPDAMLAHTRQAKAIGLPFAADPSQQLPRLSEQVVRELVEGARYLFSNEYEGMLIRQVCGWTEAELTSHVGLRVTTLAGAGCELVDGSGERVRIRAVPPAGPVEPTGAGDGFRAGFLAGIDHGLAPSQAAQLGCLIATLVLESSGSQTWSVDREDAVARLRDTYGRAESAAAVAVLNAALLDAAGRAMHRTA
jgi:adenosine kinase